MRVAGQAPGCPALRESPPANANATPRECFVLFDRHVHKNGGSTMSVLMQRLEEQGECLYWGYHLSSLQRGLTALRGLSRNSPRLPRLCIDGHVGGDLAGTTTLESLKAWQRKTAEHGLACHLFTTLRVREPLSHYVSFYLWSRAATRASRHRPSGLGDEGFLRWANSTPNLQANILLHPGYADFAEVRLESRPASAPSYLHAHVQDGDSDASREQMRQLVEHFDLAAPLERFDEALLMTADALGLRYLQHARIDPECLKLGARPQRVQLDEAAACTAFSAEVRRCFKRSKGCAPELRAACEEVVRRVAPLDIWLYDHVRTLFARRLEALGAAFTARVSAFRASSVGVFSGGPPAKPQCQFRRRANATLPDFEGRGAAAPVCRALQQPQRVGEAAWRDRGFVKAAELVVVPPCSSAAPSGGGCGAGRRPHRPPETARY